MQLDAAVAFLSRELDAALPPISPNYWGALMGLSAAVFLPFAVARATRDFGKGIIIAIAFVFLSSMLVFGTVVPLLGQHLYWTEARCAAAGGCCRVPATAVDRRPGPGAPSSQPPSPAHPILLRRL